MDASRAQAAADRTGDSRFAGVAVDASDAGAIAALARAERADAILNAVDPRFNPAIFEAAFDAAHVPRHGDDALRTARGAPV